MNPAQTKKGPIWALGLLTGGLLVGLLARDLLPTTPLHATATEGLDNFAIATGLVDDNVEGLYFLDYLTGELKCAIINPKTGTFSAFYSTNIAADFGGSARNNPKYLLVTGLANMPRGRQNFQYAKSIVYVAEANSGEVAAYSVPFNSAIFNANRGQGGEFVKLDKKQFRTTIVRD